MDEPELRIARAADAEALAGLRALWLGGAEDGFAARMAAWLDGEGERRTTWLACVGGRPAGMASLLEYRRMPKPGIADARWGYLGNMFVRGDLRGRGIGRALLDAAVGAADERGYVRLVLAPSDEAVAFYERAGFLLADGVAGERLLVRPGPAAPA